MTTTPDSRRRPTNPNPSSSNHLHILIDRDIDALYRAMTPSCTRCGSDAYTRFRYFNNKNAVIRRCAAAGEGADITNLLKLLQARFACRSPRCLADNPGKSEVEFTHNGKTRPKYAKRPRTAAAAANPSTSSKTGGGNSRKRLKPSPQQHQQEAEHHHGQDDHLYRQDHGAYPYDASMATTYYDNAQLPPLVHAVARAAEYVCSVDPPTGYTYPVHQYQEAALYAYPVDQAIRYAYPDPVHQAQDAAEYQYPIYQDNETAMAEQEDPLILLHPQQQPQPQPQGWVQQLLLEDDDEDVLQSMLGICKDGQWVDEDQHLLLPQQQSIFEDFQALLQN